MEIAGWNAGHWPDSVRLGPGDSPGKGMALGWDFRLGGNDGVGAVRPGGRLRRAVSGNLDSLPNALGAAGEHTGRHASRPVSDPVCGRPDGIGPEDHGAGGDGGAGRGVFPGRSGNLSAGQGSWGYPAASQQLSGQAVQRGWGEGVFAGRGSNLAGFRAGSGEAGVLPAESGSDGQKGAFQQGGFQRQRGAACSVLQYPGTAAQLGFFSALFPIRGAGAGARNRRPGRYPADAHQSGAGAG